MERNELCYEIEKLPASEQQTKVSLLACEMANKMDAMEKNLWATREELHEKKQRIDTLLKRLEILADGTDRIDILEMRIQNLEFELRQAKKETDVHRQRSARAILEKNEWYVKFTKMVAKDSFKKELLEEIANMRITDCDAYDIADGMKQLAREALHETDEN